MKPTHAQLVNLLREIVWASPQVLPELLARAREALCLTDAALSMPAPVAAPPTDVLDGPRVKTALDREYPKALDVINQQREELDRLRAAPPADLVASPRRITDSSPAVGVDGYDGEQVLAWWPVMKLDDDGNLTGTISEGQWVVTFRYGDGSWFEPAEMEADWCDDQQQYGEAPLYWLRLPADPVLASEGGGKQYPGAAEGRRKTQGDAS